MNFRALSLLGTPSVAIVKKVNRVAKLNGPESLNSKLVEKIALPLPMLPNPGMPKFPKSNPDPWAMDPKQSIFVKTIWDSTRVNVSL